MGRFLYTVSYRALSTPWSSLVPEVALGHGFRAEEHTDVAVGDSIELRRPDGTVISTRIEAFLFYLAYGRKCIVLPRFIRPEDVSKDTEIWLSDRGAAGGA